MSANLATFKPAQYYKGKCCYVGFYAQDPISGELRRVKIKVNHVTGSRERTKYANHLVYSINEKLYSGWNPFVEEYSQNATVTFSKACELFMQDKSDLRPDSLRSYRSYTYIICKWADENNIGDKYCFQFDKQAAKRFMLHISSDGNKSARTYNNYLRHYQTMFAWMVQNDFMKENPFADLKPKKADEKIRKTIPAEDRKKILEYFADMPEYVVIMNLCFKCFIRPKEIRMLKIRHINYRDMVLDLPPDVTKNHHERIIPIPEELRAWFLGVKGDRTDNYIFSTGFSPGPNQLGIHAIGKVWAEMREKLNLPASYQFYSLKDTGITEMLEAGVPAKLVKELADHHSLEMTERYTHKSDPKMILEWNKLEF